jgi:hypothetical protein
MQRYDTTLFRTVNIPARTSQTLIIEDWDQIGTCDVQVQMDRGLRNKIDTSYFLRRNGRLTSVKDGESLVDGSILRVETYPNPASSELRVTYALPSATDVTVELSDMLGRHVMTLWQGYQMLGRHTIPVDVSNLASGTYIARVKAGTLTSTKIVHIIR